MELTEYPFSGGLSTEAITASLKTDLDNLSTVWSQIGQLQGVHMDPSPVKLLYIETVSEFSRIEALATHPRLTAEIGEPGSRFSDLVNEYFRCTYAGQVTDVDRSKIICEFIDRLKAFVETYEGDEGFRGLAEAIRGAIDEILNSNVVKTYFVETAPGEEPDQWPSHLSQALLGLDRIADLRYKEFKQPVKMLSFVHSLYGIFRAAMDLQFQSVDPLVNGVLTSEITAVFKMLQVLNAVYDYPDTEVRVYGKCTDRNDTYIFLDISNEATLSSSIQTMLTSLQLPPSLCPSIQTAFPVTPGPGYCQPVYDPRYPPKEYLSQPYPSSRASRNEMFRSARHFQTVSDATASSQSLSSWTTQRFNVGTLIPEQVSEFLSSVIEWQKDVPVCSLKARTRQNKAFITFLDAIAAFK